MNYKRKNPYQKFFENLRNEFGAPALLAGLFIFAVVVSAMSIMIDGAHDSPIYALFSQTETQE